MSKLVSLEAAVEHLSRILPDSPAKSNIIELTAWIRDWSPTQEPPNHVFGYYRESINVGYVLDRDGNREKKAKPNCVVVKCPKTDVEFKELHLDFYLKNGYAPLAHYLTQRPSNPVRWLVLKNHLTQIGLEDLKTLFLTACQHRGGQPKA